jgi:hypothetical protein
MLSLGVERPWSLVRRGGSVVAVLGVVALPVAVAVRAAAWRWGVALATLGLLTLWAGETLPYRGEGPAPWAARSGGLRRGAYYVALVLLTGVGLLFTFVGFPLLLGLLLLVLVGWLVLLYG